MEKITLELYTLDDFRFDIRVWDSSDIPFILEDLQTEKFICFKKYNGTDDLVIQTSLIYYIDFKYERVKPVLKAIRFDKDEKA